MTGTLAVEQAAIRAVEDKYAPHRNTIETLGRVAADLRDRIDSVDLARNELHGSIRAAHQAGLSVTDIAATVGYSRQTIHTIINKETP